VFHAGELFYGRNKITFKFGRNKSINRGKLMIFTKISVNPEFEKWIKIDDG
jgi:hypothetical protein